MGDSLEETTLGKSSRLASAAKPPAAAAMGRRELVGALVGSTMIAGQAEAATSAYKKKCDENGGKCPPLVDTLLAQSKANHQTNVKMSAKLAAERSGLGKAALNGNPMLAEGIKAKFGVGNKLPDVGRAGELTSNQPFLR